MPNPLIAYIHERPSIERIAFNGAKAWSSFIRHFARRQIQASLPIGSEVTWGPAELQGRGVPIARLPSSSPIPTRAHRTAKEKVAVWKGFVRLRPSQ